jgi:tetratricopeptide (TPR) repeat protein
MMAGTRPGVDLPVYCETYYTKVHFNWSPLFGYLSGRKKYIDAPEPELYDVQQDPRELTNVLDANRALAGTLKSELFRLQARFSASGKEAESRVAIDPETMARLKSLGYVGLSASGARGTTAGLPDPKGKIQIFNQLNRGITLSRRGLADRALEAFTAVVRAEPAMPIGHFLLGTEYFDRKLYLQAIEEFILTLKHNPESNVALFSLARAYLESGQGDKAEAGLAYLLELEPEHFGARHLLSLAHARRARYDQAAAEEERALALRPDYVEGYNNLGSYYLRLDRFDAAIAAYRRALALEPKFDLARVNLALAYVRAGAWDRAIEAARAVLAADSRRPRAQLYLGQAYLGKGMKEEAREAFRKAKELDPSLNVPAIP